LESIVSQATDDVDIVISDNASDDETPDIVERFRERFPRITYFRWKENVGPDRNFLKAVELASGEYCWLLGSDDRIEDGGIQSVLDALERYPGLAGISVNRQAYDKSMTRKIPERPVGGWRLKQDTLIHDAELACTLLGDYFGYLSGQVVNRELWLEVAETHDLEGYLNAYVHVYIILNMLLRRPKWLYLHRKCVGWRSGNDSFLSQGLYRRLEIDVVGFERISRDVFGVRSRAYHSLQKTVACVHARYNVLGAKVNGAPSEYYARAWRLLVRYYWRYPTFWIKTVPLLVLPGKGLKVLRWLYRLTLKRYYLWRLRQWDQIQRQSAGSRTVDTLSETLS
jgi:abequosyltransferase